MNVVKKSVAITVDDVPVWFAGMFDSTAEAESWVEEKGGFLPDLVKDYAEEFSRPDHTAVVDIVIYTVNDKEAVG